MKPPIAPSNTDKKRKMNAIEGILYQRISDMIICAAFNVYNILGNGFLEKVYENALAVELARLGVPHEKQREIIVFYRNQVVGECVADIIVDHKIVVDVKAVKEVCTAHYAQLFNYLKATEYRLGYLLNFGQNNKLYFKRIIN